MKTIETPTNFSDLACFYGLPRLRILQVMNYIEKMPSKRWWAPFIFNALLSNARSVLGGRVYGLFLQHIAWVICKNHLNSADFYIYQPALRLALENLEWLYNQHNREFILWSNQQTHESLCDFYSTFSSQFELGSSLHYYLSLARR